MSSRSITCDLDGFARGIDELLGDIPEKCSEKVGKATEKATRRGVKTVKSYASQGGIHAWSERYVGGFSSHVDRGGMVTVGEIGNKNEPGLVHLLEKGHATPAGRRTRAFPHMAPAFDEITEDFIEMASRAFGEAIS